MLFITLLTDFGYKDNFVGVMKGVIAGIAPKAGIIDLCHDIPAQDISAGAFCLKTGYAYFPKGTIHVVVIDPGVGSKRFPLVVKTKDYYFIAPDNGVLSLALDELKVLDIIRLDNPAYHLPRVSNTFHGRDIFCAVAAHIAQGIPHAQCGTRIKQYKKIALPKPRSTTSSIHAEIIYVDRFGNLITNICHSNSRKYTQSLITIKNKVIRGIKTSYAHTHLGQALAIWGSSGFLEIAVNGGSAQKHFKAKTGDKVVVKVCR